jgi:hypothetical protein
VESGWRLEGKTLHWDVLLPPGTTAELHIPAASAAVVNEGSGPADRSPGLTFDRMEAGAAVFRAGSGRYALAAPTTS